MNGFHRRTWCARSITDTLHYRHSQNTVSTWERLVLYILTQNILKDLQDIPTFFLHRRSFSGPLPEKKQSLLRTSIQTLCEVRRWHSRGLTCPSTGAKRMAPRLRCRSWERVATRAHNGSNTAAVLYKSRRKGVKFIRPDCFNVAVNLNVHTAKRAKTINGNNFISHKNSFIRILSFFGIRTKNRIWGLLHLLTSPLWEHHSSHSSPTLVWPSPTFQPNENTSWKKRFALFILVLNRGGRANQIPNSGPDQLSWTRK